MLQIVWGIIFHPLPLYSEDIGGYSEDITPFPRAIPLSIGWQSCTGHSRRVLCQDEEGISGIRFPVEFAPLLHACLRQRKIKFCQVLSMTSPKPSLWEAGAPGKNMVQDGLAHVKKQGHCLWWGPGKSFLGLVLIFLSEKERRIGPSSFYLTESLLHVSRHKDSTSLLIRVSQAICIIYI